MALKVNGMGLVPVFFLKAVDVYSAGMVAGFEERTAQRLINDGFAVEYDEAKHKKPEAAPTISNLSESGRVNSELEARQVSDKIGTIVEPKDSVSPATGAKVPAEQAGAEQGEGNVQVDLGTGGAVNGEATGESGEGTGTTVMGADDDVEIPDNWESLHHTQRKSLARRITGEDAADAEAADASIRKALEARNA